MSAPLDRAAIQAQIAALQAQLDATPEPPVAKKQPCFVTIGGMRVDLECTQSSVLESYPCQYVKEYRPVGSARTIHWEPTKRIEPYKLSQGGVSLAGGDPIVVSVNVPEAQARCIAHAEWDVDEQTGLEFRAQSARVTVVCAIHTGFLVVKEVSTNVRGK